MSSLLLAGVMGSDSKRVGWESTAELVRDSGEIARGSIENFDFSKNGTICVVRSN